MLMEPATVGWDRSWPCSKLVRSFCKCLTAAFGPMAGRRKCSWTSSLHLGCSLRLSLLLPFSFLRFSVCPRLCLLLLLPCISEDSACLQLIALPSIVMSSIVSHRGSLTTLATQKGMGHGYQDVGVAGT